MRGVSAKSGTAEMLRLSDLSAFNSTASIVRDTLVPKALKIGVEGSHLKLTAPALSVITATRQV